MKSQPLIIILIATCISTGVGATNTTQGNLQLDGGNFPAPAPEILAGNQNGDKIKTKDILRNLRDNSSAIFKEKEGELFQDRKNLTSESDKNGSSIKIESTVTKPDVTTTATVEYENITEIKTKDISNGSLASAGAGANATAAAVSTKNLNQEEVVATTEFTNLTMDTTTSTSTKKTTTKFVFTLPANLIVNLNEDAMAAHFKKRTKGDPKAEELSQLQVAFYKSIRLGLEQYFATMKGRTATTPTTTTLTTTTPEPLYIEFMEPCKKAEEDKCAGYPDVKCFDMIEFRTDVTDHVFVCNCNYLHTLHIANVPFNGTSIIFRDTECVRNVYAPCSIGTTELKCGDNMDCITDKLGISTMKFCHCQPGFAPVPNYLGIPAFCRPIVWEEPEVEDFEIESTASELDQVVTVEILILAQFSFFILCD